MGERPRKLEDWQLERLDEMLKLRFVQKVFAVYSCLRRDRGDGWIEEVAFTGQEYDPSEYELVVDAWDHEHCWICHAKIEVGDSYWASVEPEGYELCHGCHERYIASARGHDMTPERRQRK